MPQIQDYEVQDTPAAQPVGANRPNVEEAGAVGRALEGVGEKISQTSQIIERRQAQKDVSDAYVNSTAARTKWTDALNNQVNDPNFNSDDFIQSFKDDMAKQRDQYDTAAGQNFFDKQVARTEGALRQQAGKVQIQNAVYQAKADLQNGINNTNATLQVDPSQWRDIMDSQWEAAHDTASANPKLQGQEALIAQHLQGNVAMGAIQGYIKQDPGSEAEGREGAAQKLLDSGDLDRYLTPQMRQQAERQIAMGARLADAQAKLQGRAQDKLDGEDQVAAGNALFDKMQNGTFKPSDVMGLQYRDGRRMDYTFQQQMLDLAHKTGENKLHGDPNTEIDLIRRSHLPGTEPGAITSSAQLLPYLGRGLSPTMYGTLSKQVDGGSLSPSDKASERIFLQNLKGSIVKRNMMGNGNDPISMGKYQAAYMDYQAAKAQALQNNQPIHDLWDPNSPKSFAAKINTPQYQTSPQEQAAAMANMYKQNVVNTAAAQPNSKARQAGESWQAWMKRTKDMK